MTTTADRTICIICNTKKLTYPCHGCSKRFCFEDLAQHRSNLEEQLNQIQHDHNKLREDLNDQRTDPKTHTIIEQIYRWEKNSIDKIKQTSEQCRKRWINYSRPFLLKIEKKLNDLAQRTGNMQKQKNEFNEVDLKQLKEKLQELEGELRQPPNVAIIAQSTTLIDDIFLQLPFGQESQWQQSGIIVAGNKGKGNRLDQFSGPSGLCLDDDQTVYTADWGNHRILQWKRDATSGQVVAGGNGQGCQPNQLNQPMDLTIDPQDDSLIIADRWNRRVMRWTRQPLSLGQIIISGIDCWGLAMHKDGSLYISDCVNNEVRKWKRGETQTTLVAGGNGQGNQLNQLHVPTYLFVDDNHNLYICDRQNHRVTKWMKDAQEGIVVAGGNGQGNRMSQLSSPEGVIVDQFGQIYVVDCENHRVMRWCEGANEGILVVGSHGRGKRVNQLDSPRGLSCDDKGNIYVADCVNERIQKFLMNLKING